jgi:formylglycine-generating enzyme required for sulfatase activity/class 3 adenylate cyclase
MGGRRLTAILAADIAGYSALMGGNETDTVAALKGHQSIILPMISGFDGRIIDTAGDGMLAEFSSVLNAVKCAVAIQETMLERNATVAPDRRMQFRIGINQGDVLFDDDDRIYGDGLNVAARLEGLCEPGGICISGKVYEEIKNRFQIRYEDIGAKNLKNIAEPVHIYRISVSEAPASKAKRSVTKPKWAARVGLPVIGSLIGSGLIGAVAWIVARAPRNPEPSASTSVSLQVSVPRAQPAPVPVTSPYIDVNALSPERERALRPGDTFKECSKCPEMIVVPAGTFTMGAPESERDEVRDQNPQIRHLDERPQHQVTFDRAFAVGKFAVTFEEWDTCVADGGCNGFNPSDAGLGRGRLPVINVTWNNATAYAGWLSSKAGKSYRLLSEAEREYVSRAGTTTTFWWGDSISSQQANYDATIDYQNNPQGENRQRTLPVDSFRPNPWGLYQVHGNVWEWTEDCFFNGYAGAPSDGSAWMAGDCTRHVIRGGAFFSGPYVLRAAARAWNGQWNGGRGQGFRVARTLAR